MLKTIVMWIMMILLICAAAVQYNDPDPALWIAVYLGASFLTYYAHMRRPPRIIFALYAGATLIWSAKLVYFLFLEKVAIANLIEVEEGREMLGLLIVGVWMIYLFMTEKGEPQKSLMG